MENLYLRASTRGGDSDNFDAKISKDGSGDIDFTNFQDDYDAQKKSSLESDTNAFPTADDGKYVGPRLLDEVLRDYSKRLCPTDWSEALKHRER